MCRKFLNADLQYFNSVFNPKFIFSICTLHTNIGDTRKKNWDTLEKSHLKLFWVHRLYQVEHGHFSKFLEQLDS